jgi:hypothetical protein
MVMSRGVSIAAGVVLAVAVAGAAAWWFVLRDPTEAVGVDEAVTSFRSETDAAPDTSPIPTGVYVYETEGFERTDALTGRTHRYPKRSTITVTSADCGARLLWQVLDGRSTEWIYCVTGEGWDVASQDERHTFFGTTERTTYTCESTPIRPAPDGPKRWTVLCTTGDAEERGVGRIVGRERLDVGPTRVTTEHVRKKTRFSGEIRGSSTYDLWFDTKSGVPVKIVMVSTTRNDSPVGEVTYDEDVTLRLTSLEPRR